LKKKKQTGLDFVVDMLTNSIENVDTGDSFPTEITTISSADLKTAIKTNGWQFDWKDEFKQPERDVFKLTIVNNQTIVQGLISLEIKSGHFICTWLSVHLSTKARQKFTLEFQETWLHLLANFPFTMDTKAIFPSFLKHNLFNISLAL